MSADKLDPRGAAMVAELERIDASLARIRALADRASPGGNPDGALRREATEAESVTSPNGSAPAMRGQDPLEIAIAALWNVRAEALKPVDSERPLAGWSAVHRIADEALAAIVRASQTNP